MNSTKSILTGLAQSLEPVSGSGSLHEAEIVLEHVLDCSRSELYTALASFEMPDEMLLTIDCLVQRRLVGEPLAYVLGSVFFYSKEILVTKDVLIPRPETEILVDCILKQERKQDSRFADVCTGSGAIAAVLLKERPFWNAVATDISPAALAVARRNAPDRAGFVCSDMMNAFKSNVRAFDFLVSNPPYVSQEEIDGLDISVKEFEPLGALCGGRDGLDFYNVLAMEARSVLEPGGRIYCEIGCSQESAVRKIFSSKGWNNLRVQNDLANRPRVVTASFVP